MNTKNVHAWILQDFTDHNFCITLEIVVRLFYVQVLRLPGQDLFVDTKNSLKYCLVLRNCLVLLQKATVK